MLIRSEGSNEKMHLREKLFYTCRYGIGLIAVQKDKAGATIKLNPGQRHIIRGTDLCYYMSLTEESQMTLTTRKCTKKVIEDVKFTAAIADVSKPTQNCVYITRHIIIIVVVSRGK